MIHRNRILMAEADAGSSPAPEAPAPAADVPQAQGAAVTMTREELDAFAASVADQAIAKVKDSIFADARRTFAGKQKPAAPDTKDKTPTADDSSSLLAIRDAFDDATSELKLTKGQRQILRESVMSKRPDDVDGYVMDYVARAGWNAPTAASPSQPAAPAAQLAQQAKPTNERPVSDRGAPPASQVPLDEQDIVTMSPTDRAALIKLKGLNWYRQKLNGQLKGRGVAIQ